MNAAAFRFLRELASEERVTLRVQGECMEPRISTSESVAVHKRRLYLPGDVIVFLTPAGDLAVHRVLGYRGRRLVTQGDHCVAHDAPVARDAIIGAVDGLRVPLRERAAALARFARIVARRLRG